MHSTVMAQAAGHVSVEVNNWRIGAQKTLNSSARYAVQEYVENSRCNQWLRMAGRSSGRQQGRVVIVQGSKGGWGEEGGWGEQKAAMMFGCEQLTAACQTAVLQLQGITASAKHS